MIKTGKELADAALKVALEYRTAYLLGTFGWPITDASIDRAVKGNATNAARPVWQTRAKALKGRGYLFDCVGLIKALLWGWNGTASKQYGGATYTANGVPDIGADRMIKVCRDVSETWGDVEPGEVVWLRGHIGIYVGDGLAVECTPAWNGGVQVTAVGNIGRKPGHNTRRWVRHGKLPYLQYNSVGVAAKPVAPKRDNVLQLPINIADVVQFSGGLHYPSANGTKGIKAKPGIAKVTAVSKGAKHPYHIVHADKGSNVYGWVDAAAVSRGVKKYKVTAGSGLHVRRAENVSSASITTLPYGTVVEVGSSTATWAYLPAYNGYACLTYLQEV